MCTFSVFLRNPFQTEIMTAPKNNIKNICGVGLFVTDPPHTNSSIYDVDGY